jgi:hypothetical protein
MSRSDLLSDLVAVSKTALHLLQMFWEGQGHAPTE